MAEIIEAELVTDYKPGSNIREVPLRIRTAVSAAPNLPSKIATLKKFYPTVEQDQQNPSNFLVTDELGKKFILDNKEETNFGDVVDLIRPISQAVGGTFGAIFGTPAAPGAGTAVGAGLGTAAGTQVAEIIGSAFGTEILRSPSELLSERATDVVFGTGGQLITPPIIRGAKNIVVGGAKGAEKTLKRLRDFGNAGVSPSLGQATLNQGVQTVEIFLGNIPGSSGKIANFGAKAQDDLGKFSTKIASKLINQSTPATSVRAGQQIKLGITDQGLSGQSSFVGRFKSRSNQLFGEIDNFIPGQTNVPLTNTINTLKQQVSPIQGAERTSEVFKNKFLNEVFENLTKDMGEKNALPYEAIKQLRSKIGNKLSDMSLIADVDKAQLKLVYGALSEDMKALARTKGTKAFNAYTRANKYYQSGIKRIEDFLEPISRVADPDRLTSILLNTGKEGATRINAIKKSLTDDQYKVFVSSVVERLGRIRPSQGIADEAAGEVIEGSGRFSSETFLTNWNALSPNAKNVLFSGKGMNDIKINLDTIARISSVIRESGKTFRNPSGTADRLIGQGIIFGGAGTAISGNPAFLLSVPLIVAGSSQAAKLMTNPAFIKWMAKGVDIAGNKGFDGVAEHIGRLGVVMANSDSETRQHIQNSLQMFIDSNERIQKKIEKETNQPAMP
ncbi:hypothetical protein [uncultured Mediterranean phage uvMED]|nr:hypothetical protein [uncultured Mediterranean phage uvMED]|tara:strand:+ start:1210 stop:3228 length:2019 start_codon:yes stop_codon:yes gene_type:complete